MESKFGEQKKNYGDEMSRPEECVIFYGERGQQTISSHRQYDAALEKPQVAVHFPNDGLDNILVAGKQLLVHQMEAQVFVAEKFEVQEGETQAAFKWNEIPKTDEDAFRRIEEARQKGQIEYIDPLDHPGTEYIFNKRSNLRHHACVLAQNPKWDQISGVDDFAYRDGWLWSLEEGEEKAFKLVSARIWVSKICQRITHSGEVKDSVWTIHAVSFGSRKVWDWDISQEKVSVDFLNKIRNIPGMCFANGNRVANSLMNFIRIQADLASEERILCETGWQEIDGKPLYLYGGRSIDSYLIHPDKNIHTETGRNPADIFMQMVRIFRDETLAGPLLTYSVYGLLYHLFTEAGVHPQSVLFICGPSGCRKTSVAKVIYRFFDEDLQSEPQNFQSSLGSLDELINQGRDGTLILDDFCPNTGNTNEKDMYGKLERIIRLFGDGANRKILDANHEICSVAQAHGGAVITGEVPGRGKSSVLRTLIVKMGYDALDLEQLGIFQGNKKLWPTFIASFIGMLEENYDWAKKFLESAFRENRQEGQTLFKDGRVIDHFAVLMSCCQILLKFLQANQIDGRTISGLSAQFEMGIVKACQHTEDLANDKSEWAYYVEAILNVLESHAEGIASCKRDFDKNPDFLGYFGRKGAVYFKADLLEQFVHLYLKNIGKEFCFMRNNEALGILAEKKIIKSYGNGSDKRSFTISSSHGGKSDRLIQICMERLREEVRHLS